jgi:hypothetical protein
VAQRAHVHGFMLGCRWSVKEGNRDKRETDKNTERRIEMYLVQKKSFHVTDNINLWKVIYDENNITEK